MRSAQNYSKWSYVFGISLGLWAEQCDLLGKPDSVTSSKQQPVWSGGWSEWLKILRDTGGSIDNQFLRHQPLCHLRETLGVPFFSLVDSSLSFKARVWFANLVMSDLIMFSHHALFEDLMIIGSIFHVKTRPLWHTARFWPINYIPQR